MTANEYATAGGFPSFESLFERAEEVTGPPYGTLIGPLTRHDSQITIQMVRRSVANSSDATSEVVALFTEYHWRPQLVGAVAMLTGLVNPEIFRALWIAFDSGSLVLPQLAVAAFQCDPYFEREARQRIEAGCPLNTERLDSMFGGIHWVTHSNKMLASLVTLCQISSDPPPWLEQVLARENISALLQGDTDRAEQIGTYWYKGVKQVFGKQNSMDSDG